MTTYVVLGCHRSGTSLVAHMLVNLGVHMGNVLVGPNQWNRYGHWEDQDFMTLNDAILKAAGGEWAQPPPAEVIAAMGPKFERVIAQLVALRDQRPVWGWKDPRTCLTIGLYHPHLEDPRYIRVMRNEKDIVRSLRKRAREAAAVLRKELAEGKQHKNALLQLSHGTWQAIDWRRMVDEYERRADMFVAVEKPRVINLCYEDLMGADARAYVKYLADFCESDQVDEAMNAIARE